METKYPLITSCLDLALEKVRDSIFMHGSQEKEQSLTILSQVRNSSWPRIKGAVKGAHVKRFSVVTAIECFLMYFPSRKESALSFQCFWPQGTLEEHHTSTILKELLVLALGILYKAAISPAGRLSLKTSSSDFSASHFAICFWNITYWTLSLAAEGKWCFPFKVIGVKMPRVHFLGKMMQTI